MHTINCVPYQIFMAAILLDIDECAEGIDSCAQTCINTIGSYLCSCGSDYRLASNGRTCNGKFKALCAL